MLLAGSDRNPADKPGLAAFTADLLDEGTSTRSSTQLADDVAMLGASLGSGSTMDYSSVSLYSLTSTADAAMSLLGDVVLHPAFAAAELDRVRSSRLTQLMQQRENPTALAQRVFNQALYGNHPYGYTEVGTLPSLQALTREDVLASGRPAINRGMRRWLSPVTSPRRSCGNWQKSIWGTGTARQPARHL